jgi:hypothetical protein
MSARDAARAGVGTLALCLCACAATSGKATAPAAPVTMPAPTGDARDEQGGAASSKEEAAPDDLDDLDGRVDHAWQELRALDEARQPVATTPGEVTTRCERIRGLADEICTLSDRMCTLATEHPGQPRYTQACTRAGETCRQARQAAARCSAG